MAYGARKVGYDVLSWAIPATDCSRSSGGNTTTRGRKSTGALQELRATMRDVFTVGLNYLPLRDLVIKFDYSYRRIGGNKYNSEDTFGLTVAYSGWFGSK